MSDRRLTDELTLMVILGGTGDLSRKKLLPALLDLETGGFLTERFRIIGYGRRDYSDEDYRNFTREALKEYHNQAEPAVLERFLARVSYRQGDLREPADYQELERSLHSLEREFGQCANKLFYLAVPPEFYRVIFENFADTSLPEECSTETGFTRIIVEKPFGSDLATARELDQLLGRVFREEQIFRIDHYLGKNTIQNLLTFRFTNTVFSNTWNREGIESVSISLAEDFGVEDRGGFYDAVGALRDVGQNHLLQILALIAMENPGQLAAGALRRRREELLTSLRLYEESAAVAEHTICGQYEGYTDVAGVDDDSKTETYFRLRAFVDNERWQGVPFYLESGKELNETRVDICVRFRPPLECVCGELERSHKHQNELHLELQPRHRIRMKFWVKKPGLDFQLEPRVLSFHYGEERPDGEVDPAERIPDAYEKLLFDCIRGDQTLFLSTKEVEAAWRFITPILKRWSEGKGPSLVRYSPGSHGPAEKHFPDEKAYQSQEGVE